MALPPRNRKVERQIEAEVAEELMIENACLNTPCTLCAYHASITDMSHMMKDALCRAFPEFVNSTAFCKNPINAAWGFNPEHIASGAAPFAMRPRPIYSAAHESCHYFTRKFVSVMPQ